MSHFYGLLGRKLKHSFSPEIHKFFYDEPYDLFEIEPENLDEFMKSADFKGINVTIPYKKDVIPYCHSLSETAKKIGSVNTIIRRESGTLFGDNTDYYGFSYMVKKGGVSVQGKKAIILGSGGASLTVRHVLADLGTGEIVVISRSGENNYQNLSRHFDAQIIVNTTPVGMFPNNGAVPIDISQFKKAEIVLDIIYNPSKTKLILDAEKCGIKAVNGLSMLVAQAKKSAELFCGKTFDDSVIDKIQTAIERKTKNIILIGMPGCGKTTIGKALSVFLNRKFLDTDNLIEVNTVKTVPDIIKTEGEAAFRKIETEILKEVSKQSGKIIATGGGIVTVSENIDLLKQNSIVFFLDRPLDELEVKGRPLSEKNSVETLYQTRIGLYEAVCDEKIHVHGVKETAAEIKERFYS